MCKGFWPLPPRGIGRGGMLFVARHSLSPLTTSSKRGKWELARFFISMEPSSYTVEHCTMAASPELLDEMVIPTERRLLS